MLGIAPISGQAIGELGRPVVLEVTPSLGARLGGTAVTVKGLNFATGATVRFGETLGTGTAVVNHTSITTTTPLADSPFLDDVTVANTALFKRTAQNLFDRVQSGGMVSVDPATLPNSSLHLGYAGTNWPSTLGETDPVDVYLDQSFAGDGFPTAGTAVNGFTPATFNGTSQAIDTGNRLSPYVYGGDITDLGIQPQGTLGAGGFTAMMLVFVPSAAAPAASAWLDPGLWADESGFPYLGLTFSTSGAQAVANDGTFKTSIRACSTGAWHLVVLRCSSTNISVRVDGTESTPTTIDLDALVALAGSGTPIIIGRNPFVGSGYQAQSTLFIGFYGRRLSDAEVDGSGTFFQTKFALAMGFVATANDPATFSRSSTWSASYGGAVPWLGSHKTNNANANVMTVLAGSTAPTVGSLNGFGTAIFNGTTAALESRRLTKDMIGTDDGGYATDAVTGQQIAAPPKFNREAELGWTMNYLVKFATLPTTGGIAYQGAILFTDPQAVVGFSASSDSGVMAYQIDDAVGVNNYVYTPGGGAMIPATATWVLMQARWNGKDTLEARMAPSGGSLTAWQKVLCRPGTYPTAAGRPRMGIDYALTYKLNAEVAAAQTSQRAFSTYTLDGIAAYYQTRFALNFGLSAGAYTLTASSGVFSALFKGNAMLSGRKMPTTVAVFSMLGNGAGLLVQRKMLAALGTFALIGNGAGLLGQRKIVAGLGTFAVTGNGAGLLRGRKMLAVLGTFAVTGSGAGFLAQRKMLAALGTFAFSGNGAGLVSQRRLVAAVRSYTFTGNVAGLVAGRSIAFVVGAFSFSGSSAGMLRGRVMGAAVGAFTEAGNAAGLRAQRSMPTTVGAFTEAGSATGLRAQRKMPTTVAAFALAGGATGFQVQHKLVATVAAFTFAGIAAALQTAHKIALSNGAFVESGSATTFLRGRRMVAVVAAFVEAGNAAVLFRVSKMPTTVGVFTEAGGATGFSLTRRMSTAVGVFVESGSAANLLRGSKMPTTVATFVLNGIAVAFVRSNRLTAAAGAFAFAGSAAGLSNTRKIVLANGPFVLAGTAAGIRAQRKLTTAVGAFVESGGSAGFGTTRKLTTAVGAFVEAGSAAGFAVVRKIAVTVGAFTETGGATGLRATKRMATTVGTFAFSGQAVGLTGAQNVTMAASTGVFALVGKPNAFARSRKIVMAVGVFGVTGSPANFGVKMPVSNGAFAFGSNATGLRAQRRLTATARSHALTGLAAGLQAARKLATVVGAFAESGAPVTLRVARSLAATVQAFTLAGTGTGFRAQRKIAAQAASFVVSGASAELVAVHTLSTQAGAFGVVAFNAGLLSTHILIAEPGVFMYNGSEVYFVDHTPTNYTLAALTGAFHVTGYPLGYRISYRVRLISVAAPGAVVVFSDAPGATIELHDSPGAVINMSFGRLYDVGDIMEVRGEVRRNGATGELLDPATLTVWVQPPNAALYSLVYGVAPNVYRDSLGKYRARINADSTNVGDWVVVFRATGDAQATAPRLLTVRPPAIVIPGL